MSSHRRVRIALVVFAGLLAAPAFAQDMGSLSKMSAAGGAPTKKLFVFGVGGGFSMPINDAKQGLENGFNGTAYVRIQPPALGMSFGASISFQKFDLKNSTVAVGLPTSTTDMLAGLGDMKFDLMPGPIRPYLLVGIGVYNTKTDAPVSGGGSSSISETNFGINGGAGVEFKLFAISGFVQGRIDNVYTSSGGEIDTKSIQVIPITLGIEF